jgi:alpha-tubulin suppressor-like RCC1 family protein
VRTTLAAIAVVVAASTATRVAAAPAGSPPAFRVAETVRDVVRRGRRGAPDVVVRRRSQTATFLAKAPSPDAATLTGDARVGVRTGDRIVETTLSADPRWRPGRTSARVVVRSTDEARPGRFTATFSWRNGRWRVRVKDTGEAPLAEPLADGAAGEESAPFGARVRVGPTTFYVAGDATAVRKLVARRTRAGPVSLMRLRLVGAGGLDTGDAVAPQLTIDTPAQDAAVARAGILVTGAVHDTRSISGLTWTLDDGTPADATVTPDPDSGGLRDATGTFAFSVPTVPPPGTSVLRVSARDAVGNAAQVERRFRAVLPYRVTVRACTRLTSATDSRGVAWWWGSFSYTSGPGTISGRSATPIPRGTEIVETAPGRNFVLQLRRDGVVLGWGDNARGQLGTGGLTQIVSIAAGDDFGLALRVDGTVWAWGGNASGQLGTTAGGFATAPAQVAGLPPIQTIAASYWSAYAVDLDGRLWSWGINDFGQLGRGAVDLASRAAPGIVDGPTDVVAVSAGYRHAAAVTRQGAAWGWGTVYFSELGPDVGGPVPAIIQGVTGVRDVSCGFYVTHLVLDDGTALGCGLNSSGQVGDGTKSYPNPFHPLATPAGVTAIAEGYSVFAVLDDGTLRSWGDGFDGQLGNGLFVQSSWPVPVNFQP